MQLTTGEADKTWRQQAAPYSWRLGLTTAASVLGAIVPGVIGAGSTATLIGTILAALISAILTGESPPTRARALVALLLMLGAVTLTVSGFTLADALHGRSVLGHRKYTFPVTFTATEPTEPPPQPPIGSAHGILAMTCAPSGPDTVKVLDPVDGHTVASHTLPPYLDPTYLDPASDPCAQLGGNSEEVGSRLVTREQFDRNYIRLVFETTEGHVGWIDLATETRHDVTAPDVSTSFTATPFWDFNPLFSPSTNSFWFARSTGQIYSVDLDTGIKTERGRITTFPSVGEVADPEFLLSLKNDRIIQRTFVPNQSGTLAVTTDQDSFAGYAITNKPTSTDVPVLALGEPGAGPLLPGTGQKLAIAVVDHGATACGSLMWMGDSTIVCTVENPGSTPTLYLVKVQPGTMDLSSEEPLPKNERTNTEPVASPDGSQLAFLSQPQDGPKSIYRLTVGQSGKLEKVIDLTGALTDAVLLGWQ